MKNRFCKSIEIRNFKITFETFRTQNKFLHLSHNLFKDGINKFIDREGNKYCSFVIKNFRILFIKRNNG